MIFHLNSRYNISFRKSYSLDCFQYYTRCHTQFIGFFHSLLRYNNNYRIKKERKKNRNTSRHSVYLYLYIYTFTSSSYNNIYPFHLKVANHLYSQRWFYTLIFIACEYCNTFNKTFNNHSDQFSHSRSREGCKT